MNISLAEHERHMAHYQRLIEQFTAEHDTLLHHLRKANKGCRRLAIQAKGYRALYEQYRDAINARQSTVLRYKGEIARLRSENQRLRAELIAREEAER